MGVPILRKWQVFVEDDKLYASGYVKHSAKFMDDDFIKTSRILGCAVKDNHVFIKTNNSTYAAPFKSYLKHTNSAKLLAGSIGEDNVKNIEKEAL